MRAPTRPVAEEVGAAPTATRPGDRVTGPPPGPGTPYTGATT
ncbi:MAG: hypothetical protein NTW05_11365 [Pseudonocardiales bacterium]|nr:hypothetical protein [Pseudonocardiales bacterium]